MLNDEIKMEAFLEAMERKDYKNIGEFKEEYEKVLKEMDDTILYKTKHIFVVNGHPRAGKDTFAKILNGVTSVYKYSSIECIKNMAMVCGWDGSKDEKSRKFLSDLKLLTSDFNDYSFKSVKKHVEMFRSCDDFEVMLIDIREPRDIQRAVDEFGAKTIFIDNPRVERINSNIADAHVENFKYDYFLCNNGTIEEFKTNIRHWYSTIKEKRNDRTKTASVL